jgi:membrane-bound lytic murein transglycosylase B
MSWDDDSFADEFGERRSAEARVTGWRLVRRVAAYVGVVAGVVALAVGAVFAVNGVGLAAKPGGFAAPAANANGLALPPVVTATEEEEPGETSQPADDQAAAVEQVPEQAAGATDSGLEASPVPLVDPVWTAQISAATGIPERALAAYALAHVTIAAEDAGCGLDWTTIAAIGAIESGHGSYGDSELDEFGYAQPAIIGRALDGDGVAKIGDTDGGVLDGDSKWDRAVGPMQFIPSTWEKWGSDANGDDVADPHQIDDAALSTARYLCASGSMTSPEGWRAGVYSYNHDNDYVDAVAKRANEYAASAW